MTKTRSLLYHLIAVVVAPLYLALYMISQVLKVLVMVLSFMVRPLKYLIQFIFWFYTRIKIDLFRREVMSKIDERTLDVYRYARTATIFHEIPEITQMPESGQ